MENHALSSKTQMLLQSENIGIRKESTIWARAAHLFNAFYKKPPPLDYFLQVRPRFISD